MPATGAAAASTASAATGAARPKPAECFGAGGFASARALQTFLSSHGVNAALWRTRDGAKSVESLYTELELGETQLELLGNQNDGSASVRRLCRVAKVRVTRPGSPDESLIEARQVFADGSSRARGRPLSEKIFPHEDPLGAATRGVLEELGPAMAEAEADSVWLDEDSVEKWIEIKASRSYPDLMTRYELWTVDAVVHGLPSGPFETLEQCGSNTASSAAAVVAPVVRYETSYVWSGATLRRRRRRRRDRPAAATAAASSSSPPSSSVLSTSGEPLELPSELLHKWEWVPAATLDRWEGEQRQRALRLDDEAGAEGDAEAGGVVDGLLAPLDEEFEDGSALEAAALSEDSGGCVMFVDKGGGYSVVCPGGADDLY